MAAKLDRFSYFCVRMRRLFTFLCCLCIFLTAVVAQTNKSWMAGLPDNMPVCKVSIPGTHDSGTAGVRFPMRYYARTQTMDLSDQWDAGIRFFDLRPRLENGRLRIYHGPADCHLDFEEAMNIIISKLEQHPTEFCVVMTNSAGGGIEGVDMIMDDINTLFDIDMLAQFHADMTVADMRGRVLFIHRDYQTNGRDWPGNVVLGWPGNGSSHRSWMMSSQGESAVLWAQDFFTDGGKGDYLNSKWDKVTALIREFASAPEGVWCINHLSGYTGTGVSTNIRKNARNTNARLLDWLNENKQPVGIIPMDFPSQELIDAIIDCNK